jgi:hypothetical protein
VPWLSVVFSLILKLNYFIVNYFLGWLGKGRHKSDPGDPRSRDHPQSTCLRVTQWLLHVEPTCQECARGRPRTLHVPNQHRPHEKPGKGNASCKQCSHFYRDLCLWPSGQSSWLQTQRSGFDSRCYQIFRGVLGLERGPLSLVSTTEELTEWYEYV